MDEQIKNLSEQFTASVANTFLAQDRNSNFPNENTVANPTISEVKANLKTLNKNITELLNNFYTQNQIEISKIVITSQQYNSRTSPKYFVDVKLESLS